MSLKGENDLAGLKIKRKYVKPSIEEILVQMESEIAAGSAVVNPIGPTNNSIMYEWEKGEDEVISEYGDKVIW